VKKAHTRAVTHQAACRALLAHDAIVLQQCQHSVRRELLLAWARMFAPHVLLVFFLKQVQAYAIPVLLVCDVQVVHNQTRACLDPSPLAIHPLAQHAQQGSTQTGADQIIAFHAPLATLVWIRLCLSRAILGTILSGLSSFAQHVQLESIPSTGDIWRLYHAQQVDSVGIMEPLSLKCANLASFRLAALASVPSVATGHIQIQVHQDAPLAHLECTAHLDWALLFARQVFTRRGTAWNVRNAFQVPSARPTHRPQPTVKLGKHALILAEIQFHARSDSMQKKVS